MLRETPRDVVPDGLAARVAVEAAGLGQKGVVVARIGQDDAGDRLITALSAAGVTTEHIQLDPDLPTGRVIDRPLGGVLHRYEDTRVAFDNLQWDFDLEDVAHEADAVVFGLLSRRGGQSRSEEHRFLSQCDAALKIFDVTRRDSKATDRRHLTTGLDLADGVVIDDEGLSIAVPTAVANGVPAALDQLRRESSLSVVIYVSDGDDVCVVTDQASIDGCFPADPWWRTAGVVAFLDGVLRGRDVASAVSRAETIATYRAENPTDAVPDSLVDTVL